MDDVIRRSAVVLLIQRSEDLLAEELDGFLASAVRCGQ